jgi:protein TonB
MSEQSSATSQPPQAQDRDLQGPGLLQVFTLVVWLTWLVIGIVGLSLSQRRPEPRKTETPPQPIQAQLLDVQLTNEPIAINQTSPPEAAPLPAPDAAVPPLPEVAMPSPAIAFAVPVEGPVRIVAASKALLPRSPQPVAQRIIYGVGEGKQPEPRYPLEAIREAQEGVVGIRFTVGADGHVLSAQVFSPSPWPLLNLAALEAVRDQWNVPQGANPLKEVFIRFKINRL